MARMATVPAPPIPIRSGVSSPASVRGLVAVFSSTFFELAGYFMLLPWLLLRIESHSDSMVSAGMFAATTWLGILTVTPFASAISRRIGSRACLRLSAALACLVSAGFALTDQLPVWYALEWVGGMASGLRWVVAEATVAQMSPPACRGKVVGGFETMVGSTFVVGPLLLVTIGPASSHVIWIAMVMMSLSLASSLLIPSGPMAPPVTAVGLRRHWMRWRLVVRDRPTLLFAGFLGGFFESGLTSSAPLFGLSLHLGESMSAMLMSAGGLGSALMMLPAGLMADRMAGASQHPGAPARGRRRLMIACCALAGCASLALLLSPLQPAIAAPVVFVWGAAGGALYTLALIDAGHGSSNHHLIHSTAVLVLAYTVGGITAPTLSGLMLDYAWPWGLPAALTGLAALGAHFLSRQTPSPQCAN